MNSESAKARRILIEEVRSVVLPLLFSCGFCPIETPAEPVPMWHLHRPRSKGGYDAISIFFDKKHRPLFDAVINIIEAGGIRQPWGEFIEAKNATAVAPLTRVKVRRLRHGVSVLLPRFLRLGWFGFRVSKDWETNHKKAKHACDEFTKCLEQANRWWSSQELGPNLTIERIELRVGAISQNFGKKLN